MTQYGKIKSYDSEKGSGMITPEQGGDALPFNKSGLQQQAQEPNAHQRYSYETQQGSNGHPQAVNLQMEQGNNPNQQGSNESGSSQQNQSEGENRTNQQEQSEGNRNQQGGNEPGRNQQGQNDRSPNQQGENEQSSKK